MQPQLDSSRYARSILSSSARRDVLWNVSEPGDPYDIKKSMIAKLPGDKKVFMGDHLQLVCLLQAAEIERLCEFLDEYRLKFRQIERNSLDRHSYEVQIKELTQRLTAEEALRSENSKLKDFSKRLQVEIQTLQRSSRETSLQDEASRVNYERSLDRLTALTADNQDLRRQLEQHKFQLQSSAARLEALERAKNREIEELKMSFSQLSKEAQEGALAALHAQNDSELRRLELDLKRSRELIETKNLEISELQGRTRKLQQQLDRSGQQEHYAYGLEGQLRDYQNKFVIFGTQIERLNIALRDYNSKYEDSQRKRREVDNRAESLAQLSQELEGRLRLKEQEILRLNQQLGTQKALVSNVGEAQKLISQYQSRLTLLLRENETLVNRLKNETENVRRLKDEAERLTFENSKYRLLQREAQTLRDSANELQLLRKKLAELENRSAILSQQNERLQALAKSKETEAEKGRSAILENQTLRTRITQLQYSYASRSQVEISRIKSEYQQRLEAVSRSQGSQLQSRLQIYEGELDRIKASLKLKSEQNDRQRTRIYELEAQHNRTDADTASKLNNYELVLNGLKRDNQELYARLKNAGDTQRRVLELQSKAAQTEREAERNALTLKTREEEIISLRSKIREAESRIRELEGATQRWEMEAGRSKGTYEQTLISVRSENQALNRKIAELVTESNKKLKEASQQIDRLGITLRNLTQENELLKKQLTEARNQGNLLQFEANKRVTILQQSTVNLSRENEDLKRRLADYQARVTLASQEIERLGLQLKAKIDEQASVRAEYEKFKIAFKQYENDVNSHMEGQVTRRFKEYEQRIQDLQKRNQQQLQRLREVLAENEELKRRITDSSNKLAQEVERLREELRRQTAEWQEESARYQTSIRQITWEKETVTRQFKEYQVSVNQRLEGDIQRKMTAFQQNNARLTQENNDLRRKIQQYEAEIKRRIGNYEQTIASLNKENEELRRRLQQAGDLTRRLADYQSRMALLSQQLQRVTGALKAAGQENEGLRKQLSDRHAHSTSYQLEVSRKVSTYQSNLAFLQKENDDTKKRLAQTNQRLTEANQRINEYEQRLKGTSIQFQKLNAAFKLKSDQYSRLEASVKNYQTEVKKAFSTSQQSMGSLGKENEELKKRLIQYENRIALVSQQLERLGAALRVKQEENLRLVNEVEGWRKKHTDLEASFSHTYEFEVKKKYGSYEQTISQLNRRNTDTQAKLNSSIQEIERLNNILRLKVDESTQHAINLKTQASQYEQLRRKLRESENYTLQLKSQGEGKLRVASTQIERLTGILKTKSQENEALRRQFREYELAVTHKLEGEVTSKITQYESHIAQYESQLVQARKDNDELRRRLQQAGDLSRKIHEYQSKIVLLSQEMDRLNSIITNKIQENNKAATINEDLRKQNEQLRRRYAEVTTETSRRIPQYEQRLGLLMQENQKLQIALRSKADELSSLDLRIKQLAQQNDGLRKNITNLEQSWSSKHQIEISRRTQTHEQNLAALTRDRDQQARRRSEAQARIAVLSQEIERITSLFNRQGEQLERLKRELTGLQSSSGVVGKEYETAKRHLQEYEQSIRKLYTEFQRLQGIINELKKENQTLHNMNHNLSAQINRLTLENKDLEQQASEVRLRLSDETALQKRISEHLALMIETLRQRVKEKEKEVAEVRRSSLAPNIL